MSDDLHSVIAYLNEQDRLHSARRKDHRLPSGWYSTIDAIWSVTMCARHHGTPIENSSVADGVVNALRFYRDRGCLRVYAFCLMPDHLHAVLQLVDNDVGTESGRPALIALLSRFKRYTTMQVAWKHGLHGRLWQRGFYDHVARNREDVESQCRYVLENPVRRGLCENWQDYPFAGIMDEWAG